MALDKIIIILVIELLVFLNLLHLAKAQCYYSVTNVFLLVFQGKLIVWCVVEIQNCGMPYFCVDSLLLSTSLMIYHTCVHMYDL